MTEAEHLLVCLMEECSEIQKAASKALRFGLDDTEGVVHHQTTNREDLAHELDDLAGVIELLYDRKLIRLPDILDVAGKKLKTRKYMEVSRKLGRVK